MSEGGPMSEGGDGPMSESGDGPVSEGGDDMSERRGGGTSEAGGGTSDQSRRAFLKKAAGAVPGAAIAGSMGAGACTPDGSGRDAAERREDAERPDGTAPGGAEAGSAAAGHAVDLPEATLRAVADVALPTGALGADGTETAIAGFLAWVDGFEPAAELDHPYLTGELRYGPPHPGPRWAAQLQAMDLESRRRSGTAFADRTAEERRDIVAEAVGEGESVGLPGSPARADHVAVGLLAWFYGTSEANDLCYGARVGRHLCRGIASLPEEPEAL